MTVASTMKSNRLAIAASIALACSLLPSSGSAAVTLGARDNVQIGGFFSQGYLYSSNNNYPTADKGGTWDFREMGLNASTTLGAHLRVGAQVFAQRLGALGDDKVVLDWAVADYNVSSAFGVRVGRVKYPKGLYGEALDLDVVRPGVFLPNAVYSPILRDFSASFDGGMVYGSINAGRSSFDYKLFAGDIPMKPTMGVAEFYNNSGLYAPSGTSRLSIDSVRGGQLAWNTPVSGLKFVYSYSYFTNLSTDGPFFAYAPVNLHSNFDRYSWNTASAEYNIGNWSLATEWQRTGGSIDYAALPLLPNVHDNSGWEGWYVSAARRLGERIQIAGYYGSLKARFAATSTPNNYQHDSAISLRYDAGEHVVFKLEAHHLDGTYQTFNTARIPNPAATRQDTTTLFVAKTTLSF